MINFQKTVGNRAAITLRFVSVLATLLFLAAPAASNVLVTGKNIRAEIADRVFQYRGSEKGVIVYRSSGRILIRTSQGYVDFGSWKIKGDRMCTRLAKYRNGREKCFQIFRLKKNRYKTDHGFWLTHVKAYRGS